MAKATRRSLSPSSVINDTFVGLRGKFSNKLATLKHTTNIDCSNVLINREARFASQDAATNTATEAPGRGASRWAVECGNA